MEIFLVTNSLIFELTQLILAPSSVPGHSRGTTLFYRGTCPGWLRSRAATVSMCPPFCRTTQSRRRRHSLTLLSMNDCGSFRHASTIASFNSQTRRNFDAGRPSADEHPSWYNKEGSNPGCSVATMNCMFSCLAVWEGVRAAAVST